MSIKARATKKVENRNDFPSKKFSEMKKGSIFAFAYTPTIIRKFTGLSKGGYYEWEDLADYNDPDGFEGYGDATQFDDTVTFIAKNENEYDTNKRSLYYAKVSHLIIAEDDDME